MSSSILSPTLVSERRQYPGVTASVCSKITTAGGPVGWRGCRECSGGPVGRTRCCILAASVSNIWWCRLHQEDDDDARTPGMTNEQLTSDGEDLPMKDWRLNAKDTSNRNSEKEVLVADHYWKTAWGKNGHDVTERQGRGKARSGVSWPPWPPKNLELRSEISYVAYIMGVKINITCYMIELDFWSWPPLKNASRACWTRSFPATRYNAFWLFGWVLGLSAKIRRRRKLLQYKTTKSGVFVR